MKNVLIALILVSLLSVGLCVATENGDAKEILESEEPARELMNILETAWTMGAWDMGNFSTFVAGAWVANLTETLTKEGPFTVLLPTDEAFSEVPGGGIYTRPDNDFVVNALKYHVISGEVFSKDMKDGASLQTLQGDVLSFKVSDEGVMIYAVDEGAEVTQVANVTLKDIECTNGVIHVIDKALIPPNSAILTATFVSTGEGEGRYEEEILWPPQDTV